MMKTPQALKYTKTHEWVRTEPDGTVAVGITDFAQDALGDIVFVEFPKVGAHVSAGDAVGVVESVKAASDIYAPVAKSDKTYAFDAAGDAWKPWITNHFGNGIITWNSPFLFRTGPAGSRFSSWARPTRSRRIASRSAGLSRPDWASMTFTMNWKIVEPGRPVRFERGEPVFHVIPLARNPCRDLENAEAA